MTENLLAEVTDTSKFTFFKMFNYHLEMLEFPQVFCPLLGNCSSQCVEFILYSTDLRVRRLVYAVSLIQGI
jgi:hypothetical protein